MEQEGIYLKDNMNTLIVNPNFDNEKGTLKKLEQELQDLTQTRDEYTSLIEEFSILHDFKVGEIISEILTIKEKKSRQKALKKINKYTRLEKRYLELKEIYEILLIERDIIKKRLRNLDENTPEYLEVEKEYEILREKTTKALVKMNKAKKNYFIEKEQYNNDEDCIVFETIKMTREQFEEELKEIKKEDEIKLSKQMKAELKNLYKKASKLCHPDIVMEEQREEANRTFQQLNEAYKSKDLNQVKEIYENLKNSHFINTSDSDAVIKVIKNKISNIEGTIGSVKDEIVIIQNDETFNLIQSIDDWDKYFEQLIKELKEELKNLKKREPKVKS